MKKIHADDVREKRIQLENRELLEETRILQNSEMEKSCRETSDIRTRKNQK